MPPPSGRLGWIMSLSVPFVEASGGAGWNALRRPCGLNETVGKSLGLKVFRGRSSRAAAALNSPVPFAIRARDSKARAGALPRLSIKLRKDFGAAQTR